MEFEDVPVTPGEHAPELWDPNAMAITGGDLEMLPDECDDDYVSEEELQQDLDLEETSVMVEKLLDLSRPVITPAMVNFLLRDGVCETFVGFLTRMPSKTPRPVAKKIIESDEDISGDEEEVPPSVDAPSEADDDAAAAVVPGGDETPDYSRTRDWSPNSPEMRRSYIMMYLTIQKSKAMGEVLSQKLSTFVLRLFDVFDPASEGNFNHFAKCMEHILREHTNEALEVIDKHNLCVRMLHYIHYPAVSPTLVLILRQRLLGPPEATPASPICRTLATCDLATILASKMRGTEEEASACNHLMTRLVDEVSMDAASAPLFPRLVSTSDFVDACVESVVNKDKKLSREHQRASASTLDLLLKKSGSGSIFAGPPTSQTEFPNLLACIRSPLVEYLLPHLGAMGELLSDQKLGGGACKLPGHRVASGLTTFRVCISAIIRELVLASGRRALDLCPASAWRVMGSWMLTYRFNNIFHNVFFVIFREIVMLNHEPSLQSLLSKGKFLSKAIDHFTSDAPSGCKGFLLLMFNMIRLKADSQEGATYLTSLLQSHDKWKAFVPRLREETEKIAKAPANLPTRPCPHFGPTHVPVNMYEDDGIDLGSNYAKSIGFDPDVPHPDPSSPPVAPLASGGLSSLTSGSELSSTSDLSQDEIVDGFLDAPKSNSGGGGKKKKKNKKKKKK